MFSRILISLSMVLASSVAALADGTPAWLTQAASLNPPAYEKDVKAVVLRNEQQVTLDGEGKLVTVEKYAVRILSRDGRRAAVAFASYLSKYSHVRDMEAWLIAPNGTVKTYGKKEIIDQISDPDDIYDETRVKIINASSDSDVGYVFGYTVTTEDRPLFYQDNFAFQGDLPTLSARYSLTLPSGWSATGMTFNYADVKPNVSGTTYTWEVSNLPPIPDEPMSPSFMNLAPRLGVNYAPANSSQGANRTFTNWLDVSRWATALHETQVVVDDAVAAKAQEVTANAKTELEVIQAIGSFVQNMQYISIDIGVGYGNGYKPRPSNLVLARGYGDCKDKANLMRAMLRVKKIDAYPVAIFSGDPDYVRKEWPSPRQFNHVIIAVRVSPTTNGPTVFEHPTLGRMLIFDATDENTPVGDLPDYLQGSYALIASGDKGDLVKMPVTPSEFNAWSRETEIDLSTDGSITGVIRERATGQESRNARTMLRRLSNDDFNKSIEKWLSRGATAAKLTKLTPKDRQRDAAFDMDLEFTAPAYGQVMQDRLLVFKPAVANRSNSIYLTEKIRKHPVVLDSNSFTERATIKLPVGFVVDEVPDPVSLQTGFGKYSTTYEVKEGKLIFTRSLVMNRTTVGVDRYKEVRDFFTSMLNAEQSPVVLVRK